jgi:cobalt-zinc-cadmium efflux system outer membrane protein
MVIAFWRAGVATLLVATAGCASVPLEQGRSGVHELLASRVSADAATDAQLREWLAAPLTLENAQRIALLRNPRLQAEYAQLGLSAADVFEAGRLQNPSIGLAWLFPRGAAEGAKFGASASLGFTDLLLRRSKTRIAAAEYAGTQARVAAAVLDLLVDTQRAWFDCVAAAQRVAVRRSIQEAAAVSADLAGRYFEAGNISQLELQVQRAEATGALIEAQDAGNELIDARAQLQAQLGLAPRDGAWTTPDALPDVPKDAALADVAGLQRDALEQRLDLAAARRRVQALEAQLGATRRYRYVTDLRAGADFEREADGARRLGPSVGLALPLFHQGQGAVTRAASELDRARAEAASLELQIQADVERQAARLRGAHAQVASYRDGLIPQREAVVARLKEQANFMLIDSFAVLVARQQEYAAYAGYVDAVQRYWTAQVELLRATGTQRGGEVQP